MSTVWQATQIMDISDIVGDRQFVSLSIGPDLQPIVLSLKGVADYRRVNQFGASFAKLFASKSNRFRVHYRVDGQWAGVDLAQTHENYHHVQPLPALVAVSVVAALLGMAVVL